MPIDRRSAGFRCGDWPNHRTTSPNGRPQQAGQTSQERRLTGAVCPQQGHDLPRSMLKSIVVKNQSPVSLERQPPDFNRGAAVLTPCKESTSTHSVSAVVTVGDWQAIA